MEGSVSPCHDYASSLGRFFLFTFHLSSLSCTILRPLNTTPGIACDSKSRMTDRLGPPVRPRSLVRYLADSRAWPSPLWASNNFLVCSSPFSFDSRLLYALFYSIPFHSINASDLICFHSFPFDSLLFVSLSFVTILCLARDLWISLYINCCMI